jgi:hypothetical protein
VAIRSGESVGAAKISAHRDGKSLPPYIVERRAASRIKTGICAALVMDPGSSLDTGLYRVL